MEDATEPALIGYAGDIMSTDIEGVGYGCQRLDAPLLS